MEIKQTVLKIKGMNKDLSYSAYNPEFSWHNHNIRLTPREENDLMSITNERGNLKLSLNAQILSMYNSAFVNYVNGFKIIKYKYISEFVNYIIGTKPTIYSYISSFNNYIYQTIPSTYSYSSEFIDYNESVSPRIYSYVSIFNNYINQLIFA